MRLTTLILLLSLSVSNCGSAEVYKIRPSISNQELLRIYEDIMYKFCGLAETRWSEAEWSSKAGYWGNGIAAGNEGIRAVANTALVFAVLSKHTDVFSQQEKEFHISRAKAGLRFAFETHNTGDQLATNDRQWGDSWQSAMWTGNAGFAAWILWDELDPELRALAERVVVHEANRFLDKQPPGQRYYDTKAEENGWDLICIALAPNMFPDHPNADRWREKAIEYMMNVISVPQDAKDETIVDGRPVNEWVSTVNVHPDFTLENHGFFHPSYLMVSPAEVGQASIMYAYADNPIPQAASHHLLDNWRLAQTFMLPSSYWGFAQGMDWFVNSSGHTMYLSWLNTYAKVPLAGGMEKLLAQYIAGNQSLFDDGSICGPSSRLGYAREAIHNERISYAYLQHKLFGPAPENTTVRDIAHKLNGVRRFTFIDVMTHRTDHKFASFSWKFQNMGYLMPIGEGNESSPFFTTPITHGFVGRFELEGSAGRDFEVTERYWNRIENGFMTEGSRKTNDGKLKQDIEYISIGEKTVIYSDRVTALEDITVTAERGVAFGIQNDEFTGNRRSLHYQGGSQVVLGEKQEDTINIPGKWANVDGRLGVVSVMDSGLTYRTFTRYTRDGAREDFLFVSFSDEPRNFKSGETVARRAAVFFAESSPEETARLAEKISVEEKRGDLILRMILPEGEEYKAVLK